ncbi:MAG: chromosomal replication initiator protein DnaA [Bacteroidetes bacterium]|nr:chromosomal replication initiator protein DnaA [Bacteroidota bacterium]
MNNDTNNYSLFWKETLSRIRSEISEQEYFTWFNRLEYESSKANEIIFSVPSIFIQDQIKQRYIKNISSILNELTGTEIKISFIIKKQSASQLKNETHSEEMESKDNDNENFSSKKKKHHTIKNDPASNSYSFDTFVIGDNSSFAFNACMAIAKNPGTTYNPCLIYGGVGLGKTHLIQSINNYVSENTQELDIKYVTAETFTNEFIKSVGDRKTQQFKNKYRKVDILLIDDIHFLQGKSSTQEELFHTFNDLYDSNKQMVFTCDRPVSELKELTARLRSRFERGLNVDLQPPNFETRMAILRKKCEKQEYEMSDDVLTFISKNINTNVRDLEASLTKLIAYSKLLDKKITLEIAQEQLKDSYSLNREQSIAIETIQRVVADYFNLSYFELRGKKRTRTIAFPRQIAMYISRKMTDYSTTEIGYEFGGRDHTTVMHACQRIEGQFQSDSTMDNVIQKLTRSINEYRRN